MKITICGSMTHSKKMLEIEKELIKKGHKIILPKFTKEYAKLDIKNIQSESVKNKIAYDLIRDYFYIIKESDAILVINEDKHEIKNYIGGNSFLEMGFAHILNKKVYLLKPIPNMSYSDEIIAINPEVLNGDLDKIK